LPIYTSISNVAVRMVIKIQDNSHWIYAYSQYRR